MKNLVKAGRTIVKIDRTAKVSLSGKLILNDSWMRDLRKKYISELILEPGASLVLHDDCVLYQGSSIYVASNACLEIEGGTTFLNTCSQIECYNHIKIGRNSVASDNCRIQDSDIHYVLDDSGTPKPNSAPIIIGDDVWIGMNCIILKGVTIGNGSAIGAGSVVTKSIPEHCLACGNPAKVVKTDFYWTGKVPV